MNSSKFFYFYRFILLFLISIQIVFYFNIEHFNFDVFAQYIASINLYDFNGYSILYADATDASIQMYKYLTLWPFGYSLLIGFIDFFLHDSYWSFIFLDILGLILFNAVWFKIFEIEVLKINPILKVVFFLFITVGYTPLRFWYFGGSNLYALLSASLFLYVFIKYDNAIAFKNHYPLILFVLAIIPILFRWAYAPVTLVFFLFALKFHYDHKSFRKVFIFNSILLLFAIVLVFIMYLSFYYIPGVKLNYVTNYYPNLKKEIYWDNLKYMVNFISSSICQPFDYKSGVISELSINYKSHNYFALLYQLAKISVNFVITILALQIIINSFKSRFEINQRLTYYIWRILIPSCLLTMAMLIYLSLTTPIIKSTFNNKELFWTYIGDIRYFNLLNLSVLIILINEFLRLDASIRIFSKIIGILFLLCFCYNSYSSFNSTINQFNNIKQDLFSSEIQSLKIIIPENFKVPKVVLDAEFPMNELKLSLYPLYLSQFGVAIYKSKDFKIETKKAIELYVIIEDKFNDGLKQQLKQLVNNKKLKLDNSALGFKGLVYKGIIYPDE